MSLPTNKRARLQVQFWGHPISAGTGAIDYFVSSRWDWQCDSEHGTPQSHFNEQLVLFEVCKPVLWELLFVTSVLLIRLFRFVSQSLSFAFHRPPGPSMTARDAMRSRLSRLFSVLAAAPASKSPWEEHDLLESAEGRGDSWQTTAQLMSQAMAAEERELRRSSRAVAS